MEFRGLAPAVVVVGHHDGPRPDPHAVEVVEPQDPGRQHDPRPIVGIEQRRSFRRAGGQHQAVRADPDERAALGDRHQPVVVDPDRGRRRQVLDPRFGGDQLRQPRGCLEPGQPIDPFVAGYPLRPHSQVAAQGCPVIGQHDPRAAGGRLERRQATGRTATHDGHGRVQVAPPLLQVRARLDIDPAKPRDPAQDRLVQRPEAARADERLVVEADREEALEPVGQAEHVEPQRRQRVLVADGHAGRDRRHAGADVRLAVHLDQAVRAASGCAQDRARPVVLEAARQDIDVIGGQRRRDGVPADPGVTLAIEPERHGFPMAKLGAGRGGSPPAGRLSPGRLSAALSHRPASRAAAG